MKDTSFNNLLLLLHCCFKIAERELVFSKDYEQRAKAQVKHSQSNIINMTQCSGYYSKPKDTLNRK